MSNQQNKNKRAFILAMTALSFIVILFAYFYYSNKNSSNDPRIVEARELYQKYNAYASENDITQIFSLLDSVEHIYSTIPHYTKSFEVGVLYNNRAAAYLTMALYDHKPGIFKEYTKDSLLTLAKVNVITSINIYENWLNKYQNKSADDINSFIATSFYKGLSEYSKKEKQRFLKNRIKEIETAQYETKRRLSVAYTNLGIINRHLENYENAIVYYQKAIELWDQNLTAENNLNILLGKPLKKRNLIQKLFPPKRKED
jgi:tetratricopeptide (TPR) repeat protein